MNITPYIEEFVKLKHRYKPYSKICKSVLLGEKPFSLNSQDGYKESEYLRYSIKSSVKAYSSNKDMAIALYKDFVLYLDEQGVKIPAIDFPPVPVSVTFERLMFIAKYLQEEEHRISDLEDILWVSSRTIEDDISRLRGLNDPIQVCGKKFFIPDTERHDGRIQFLSTAHPLFLSENLTQVLIMLKGLKKMSEDPLYKPYAEQSAREIWNQLSVYARKRIRCVLRELLPEDLEWYESLSGSHAENSFETEEACSRICNEGPSVMLDCLKNDKPFCMEYAEDCKVMLYKDCVFEKPITHDESGYVVNCSGGRIRVKFANVLRSAYTVEELITE